MRRTRLIALVLGLAFAAASAALPAFAQDGSSLGSVLAEKLRLFPSRSRAQQQQPRQQQHQHQPAHAQQHTPPAGAGQQPAPGATRSSRRPASERRPVPPPTARVEQQDVEDAQPAARAPVRVRPAAPRTATAPRRGSVVPPTEPADGNDEGSNEENAEESPTPAEPAEAPRVARKEKSLADRLSAARRMKRGGTADNAPPAAAEEDPVAPEVPSTAESFDLPEAEPNEDLVPSAEPAPQATPVQPAAEPAPENAFQPAAPQAPYQPVPVEQAPIQPAPIQAAPVAPPVGSAMPAEVPTTTGDILMARQSPVISVETTGPRRILVGREAVYKIAVNNAGNVPAGGVQVQIVVPEGADVVGLEPTAGETITPEGAPAGSLIWALQHVPGGAHQELTLRIIPRSSRPFDLGVQWAFASQATQTVVEVQEPKLLLTLSGPEELRFGRTSPYKLIVSNPGTGEAENVVVRLLPGTLERAGGETFQVGLLKPSESRTLEFNVAARTAGTLPVQAEAVAEGGLRATVSADVLVRKAELKLDVAAPRMIYAGTAAVYKVVLTNPGNDAAQNVRVVAPLAEGARVIDAGRGQVDASRGQVFWSVPVLAAGGREEFELHCELSAAGIIRQTIAATADDQLEVAQTAAIQVEALADLRLEVEDPQGPVPVGQEITYTVRVRNRGSKAAEGIDVVGFFSDGVEPLVAQGGAHQIGPGQVVFDRLGVLPAGREIVLKIKAKADQPGNHIFRCEVRCEAAGTSLASEETTRVYGEAGATAAAPAEAPAEAPSGEPVPAESQPTGPTQP